MVANSRKRISTAPWRYDGPGCAFTSENLLARAGGELAAAKVEEKLGEEYRKLGFTSSNTQLTFAKDGTFSAKINGRAWNSTYTYNPTDASLQLKGLLINLNGYVVRNGLSGISVLFESKKVLTLFQTMAAVSGNSTAQVVGDISKNYDGVRVGFDLKKIIVGFFFTHPLILRTHEEDRTYEKA